MKTISREELKQIQISILDRIDEYCRINKITYFLFAGTLIGAVRHQGYIPWDDDLDICMKREDYDRFFQQFNKEAEGRYKAICFENNNEYYLASGKVIDTKTIMYENTESTYPIGVYVDIFPLDRVPTDAQRFERLERELRLYRKMLLLKNITYKKGRSVIKNLILSVAHLVLKPISHQYILRKIRQFATMYANDSTASHIGDISVFTYGKKELFPIADFSETEKMMFEGKQRPVPQGYEHVLSSMYGNYMKFPPKEKQISHHDFEAYWKE